MEKTLRALENPKKAGYKRAFLRQLFEVPSITPSGLYVGRRGGINVDLERLGRVVERMVRGLYLRETGIRLPSDCLVRAWAEDGLADVPKATIDDLRVKIVAPVLNRPVIRIGEETFEYRYILASDEPRASGWLLKFYSSTTFLVVTIPSDRLVKRSVLPRNEST